MEATTMTLPKLEAGSVSVPASVLHQFSATQDLAKTTSVRCLGEGHCSFGIYTGAGAADVCHAAHEAPPFGRFGFQAGSKKGSSLPSFFMGRTCQLI